METLTRLFDTKVVGEELISGRKAWRVESDAKPGVKSANAGEEELLAAHRTTWFDEQEGLDLQRRTTYLRGVHGIKPGTMGEIEWGKIGDTWLPIRQVFLGEVKFYGIANAYADKRTRFYDYKRFATDSTFIPAP